MHLKPCTFSPMKTICSAPSAQPQVSHRHLSSSCNISQHCFQARQVNYLTHLLQLRSGCKVNMFDENQVQLDRRIQSSFYMRQHEISGASLKAFKLSCNGNNIPHFDPSTTNSILPKMTNNCKMLIHYQLHLVRDGKQPLVKDDQQRLVKDDQQHLVKDEQQHLGQR